ncbi:M23 family metallopeptidase [Brevundimonas sp. 2R-24]|uniref:M23 family metallopeptidase n=1 Tax=Peiella sedimenti TaxID=3061083 RepID=A0ABT8SIN3_9CAUL|nr:M23 family metallopeptidase [Caulobacteraceae bacterium XZ-24]
MRKKLAVTAVFDVRRAVLVSLGALLVAVLSLLFVREASAKADIDVRAATAAVARTISFAAPVDGYDINSRFGLRRLSYERRARMHEGVDYAAPTGSPVLAVAEGEVVGVGNSSSYGRYVEVRHANGLTSFYAHLSRIHVAEGDAVAAGAELGKVGSTGRVTGPHLHFEIRRNGQQVDPQRFLGRTLALRDIVPEGENGERILASLEEGPAEPVPYAQLAQVVYR